MLDILKIIFIFGIIVFLLKKKWNLGLVMALSSVILAFLYLLSPSDFIKSFISAATDRTTVTLIIALTLIRVFENIMRTRGVMQKMMDSFRGMVMDSRILMASMPALIGLLPSMGGALFSAPMVEEASKNIKISAEKKAFINYIFRHPWEFILPLYPGIILASAITSFSVRDIIIANMPYAVCLVSGGIIWGLAGINYKKEQFKKLSGKGLISFIPLSLILLLVIGFHINLSLSIAVVTAGLFITLRYSFRNVLATLKEGFSWDIVLIILGVMTFKSVLDFSGAVTNISAFFTVNRIPVLPLLFILPFVSGLLTGLTVGFVSSTFPIIMGIESANHISAVSFAFASGYVGVLLSPVHLCLVLTREYFKAALPLIYTTTLKVAILIMLAAVIQYVLLN